MSSYVINIVILKHKTLKGNSTLKNILPKINIYDK